MKKKSKLIIFFLVFFAAFAIRHRMDGDYQKGQSQAEWLRGYQEAYAYYQKMSALILADSFHFNDIELIHIAPGERYFSKLGHVFLHFVGSGENIQQDLTVSFLVDANEYDVDNWKGFIGGKYKIYPLIKTMNDHIQDYLVGEHRALTRYLIPTTPENKELLKENLRRFIRDRNLLGTWSFYNNNCTNLVNQYLLSAKIPSPLGPSKVIFPSTLVETYQKAHLISGLGVKIESP